MTITEGVFRQQIYQSGPQTPLHMYIQQLCMVEPHYVGITRPRRTKRNQTTLDEGYTAYRCSSIAIA